MKEPLVTRELLEWLEFYNPDCCPSLADIDRQIWAAVGKQELIKSLRALHRSQQATHQVLESQ